MSLQHINGDHQRFKDIVRGKIKQNLKQYIKNGELIAKINGKMVKVPLPSIDIPTFTYGQNGGGVGTGDANVGDTVNPKPGKGEIGEGAGDHSLEEEMNIAELATLLGEELKLPRIEPKGKKSIPTDTKKYTAIRRLGPEGLKHFRRTYKNALLNHMASGTYDFDNPIIIPQKEDMRYRSSKQVPKPEFSAVIIYMMDVSGSMGNSEKHLVQSTTFWIDAWIASQYKDVQKIFIIHDSEAKEVDSKTFYSISTSGGTLISSAYKLCAEIIENRFNPNDYNIYTFHFSDGDSLQSDYDTCTNLIKDKLAKYSNQFCYGEVHSGTSSGGRLMDHYNLQLLDCDNVILQDIYGDDGILSAIKAFLGSGR